MRCIFTKVLIQITFVIMIADKGVSIKLQTLLEIDIQNHHAQIQE